MKIVFTISGKDHVVDRDDRLDKILVDVASQITQQNADEDAKRLANDPTYVAREPVTAGQYTETLVMPAVFDPLLRQQDDQRKGEIASKYDKVDEKTKVFVVALNKKLVDRVIAGDATFVSDIEKASGISL